MNLREHVKSQFNQVVPVEISAKHKRVRLMMPDAISDETLTKVICGVEKWLQENRELAQSNYGHNEISTAYYNGYYFAIDELISSVQQDDKGVK